MHNFLFIIYKGNKKKRMKDVQGLNNDKNKWIANFNIKICFGHT